MYNGNVLHISSEGAVQMTRMIDDPEGLETAVFTTKQEFAGHFIRLMDALKMFE